MDPVVDGARQNLVRADYIPSNSQTGSQSVRRRPVPSRRITVPTLTGRQMQAANMGAVSMYKHVGQQQQQPVNYAHSSHEVAPFVLEPPIRQRPRSVPLVKLYSDMEPTFPPFAEVTGCLSGHVQSVREPV